MIPNLSRRSALQLGGGALAGGLASLANAPLAATGATTSSTTTATTMTTGGASAASDAEPNVEAAMSWWAPQRQVWTPLGWKGHLFRFDVFYNGTMVCQPAVALPPSGSATLKPYLTPYKGKDFQVTPVMPERGGIPQLAKSPYYMHKGDFGVGIQGWKRDQDTPVLWTEWRRQEGLVLRQRVFAHMKGGGPVGSATEPIYAWQRYSVEHVDELVAPKRFEFVLRLSKAFLKHFVAPPEQQEAFLTMQVTPAAAPLDGPLRMDGLGDGHTTVFGIYDTNGQVRLVTRSSWKSGIVGLTEAAGHPNVYDLRLSLAVEKGAHIDVLVPMLPQTVDEATREWRLGWDGALGECEAFWAPAGEVGAVIKTPEGHVNEFFRRSVQLAEVIAEKSPDSGKFTFLSGSYGYDLLWSTPTSMISHMFLDLLGRHEVVDRHIDVYRAVQGKRQPPGQAYRNFSKDGFFATPLSLQSFDWLGDHGAVLEAAARHALLTLDEGFLDRWLNPIIAGCDFIKRACEYTNHDGVPGIMPAAASNDTGVEQQSIWIQVWNFKGLATAVQLLHRLNHPRAGEFAALVDSFRTSFVTALRDAAAAAPTWTHPSTGAKHPALPTKFTGPDSPWPFLEAFDTGALTAVWAGLMPADDPLMTSYLEFFRVGPNTQLFDPAHHTALDRVVLDHEQSSGEPCYSWNIFHSWQTGDRAHFLEGLYGLITGATSPDTFVSGEHRHGMYGTLFVQPLITWAARHAVIDDTINHHDSELHLLRLCPLAWISTDQETTFNEMPTLYGPMTLRFRLSADSQTLDVSHTTTWRDEPNRIVMHTPPVPGLRWITVNGQRHDAGQPIEL